MDDSNGLRALRPIADAEAAGLVSAEARAALLALVIATPVNETTDDGAGRRQRRSWNPLQRPVALGAVLVVAVLLVVLLPGLLSGNGSTTEPVAAQAKMLRRITAALASRPGTIVVQKTVIHEDLHSFHDKVTVESVLQTSTTGHEQRTFVVVSRGDMHEQAATDGNLQEVYDPKRNMIYAATQAGIQAAQVRQLQAQAPKGSKTVMGTSTTISSNTLGEFLPGRTSVFEQQLRAGLYKIAGRTTIAGRPVLKLVPSHRAVVLMNPTNGSHVLLGTVYLQPGTYYPIKNVVELPNLSVGGKTFKTAGKTITDWLEYKVLPATPVNEKLVSLTAQHPTARVVNSAAGYLAASQATEKR